MRRLWVNLRKRWIPELINMFQAAAWRWWLKTSDPSNRRVFSAFAFSLSLPAFNSAEMLRSSEFGIFNSSSGRLSAGLWAVVNLGSQIITDTWWPPRLGRLNIFLSSATYPRTPTPQPITLFIPAGELGLSVFTFLLSHTPRDLALDGFCNCPLLSKPPLITLYLSHELSLRASKLKETLTINSSFLWARDQEVLLHFKLCIYIVFNTFDWHKLLL